MVQRERGFRGGEREREGAGEGRGRERREEREERVRRSRGFCTESSGARER